MSTRKSFLTAAAALPLIAAVPNAQPSPTPSPSPSPKPASEAAHAFALRMRSFDASLSDKDIEEIARGIDGDWGIGKAINPKGRALQNWDEPATPFAVPE